MAKEYYFPESEVQERFDYMMDLIETEGAHIFITRDGEAVAVLIPAETYQHYIDILGSDWQEERND